MTTPLERAIDAGVQAIVETINEATDDAYFRQAAARYLVRAVAWACVNDDEAGLGVMGDEIAEQLDLMADLVRDQPPEREEEAGSD